MEKWLEGPVSAATKGMPLEQHLVSFAGEVIKTYSEKLLIPAMNTFLEIEGLMVVRGIHPTIPRDPGSISRISDRGSYSLAWKISPAQYGATVAVFLGTGKGNFPGLTVIFCHRSDSVFAEMSPPATDFPDKRKWLKAFQNFDLPRDVSTKIDTSKAMNLVQAMVDLFVSQ